MQPKHRFVRTFRRQPKMEIRLVVQPWEVLGARPEDVDTRLLDVFKIDDTADYDFVQQVLRGEVPFERRNVKVWKQTLSDVEGCVCLRDPQPVTPAMQLNCKTVPILSLLDALEAAGFAPVRDKVWHAPGGAAAKTFDTRGIRSKRAYMQCVLGLEDLFARGAVAFPSGLSNAFYTWLLKAPKDADQSLTAAQINRRLQAISKDPIKVQALAVGASIGSAAKIAKRPAEIGDDGSDDSAVGHKPPAPFVDGGVHDGSSSDGVAAGIPPPPLAGVAPPAPVGSGGSGDSSSSSDSSAPGGAESSDSVAGGAPDAEPRKRLNGQALVLEDKDGVRGYRVACNNPAHRAFGCKKYRSLQRDVAIFGPTAPEKYLACWHSKSYSMGHAEHKTFRPSVAEIRAWLDAGGW